MSYLPILFAVYVKNYYGYLFKNPKSYYYNNKIRITQTQRVLKPFEAKLWTIRSAYLIISKYVISKGVNYWLHKKSIFAIYKVLYEFNIFNMDLRFAMRLLYLLYDLNICYMGFNYLVYEFTKILSFPTVASLLPLYLKTSKHFFAVRMYIYDAFLEHLQKKHQSDIGEFRNLSII